MKDMRNARRLIAAFLLLAATAGLAALDLKKAASGAAKVVAEAPKPTAEVRSFKLEAISLRDVTFGFDLVVKNPYPVGLTFDGMTLDFTVEGAKVFATKSKGGFSVGANSEKSNAFTVTLAYDAIIKLVKNYIEKDWLNTVIDGTLVIPIPKMTQFPSLPPSVTFTYKFEKKIPAIKPQVAVLDFSVKPPTQEQIASAIAKAGKKVDPGKALGVFKNVLAGKKQPEPIIDPADIDVPLTVSFTISVKNDAKGPISFDKLGYELFVNGEKLVVGESAKVVRQGDRSLVTVDNEFSSKRLSKSVKAIFESRKGEFGVKGSASLKLPDEIRKEAITLAIDESGAFSIK
jgi:LEA14-like dessication related protein